MSHLNVTTEIAGAGGTSISGTLELLSLSLAAAPLRFKFTIGSLFMMGAGKRDWFLVFGFSFVLKGIVGIL